MKIRLEHTAVDNTGVSQILRAGKLVATVSIVDGKYYWRPIRFQRVITPLPYATREAAVKAATHWLRDRATWVGGEEDKRHG